jgi:hypothetical protein
MVGTAKYGDITSIIVLFIAVVVMANPKSDPLTLAFA